MRDYILTPSERQIIKDYLETGRKLEGFRTLLCRARKQDPKQISDDQELLKQFIAKASTK